MSTLPPLLETYEEARLLLEAKGWGLAKAAEHLREMGELARFHISHPKLSMKTKPGSTFPIEPEVAAAVEGMQTWRGYEQQMEIVTAGLRAAHAGRPAVGVRARLPAVQRVSRFFRRLAEKFRRASWKPIAISAGSGALVACCALLLAPLLAGATKPGPLMLIVAGAGPDGSPVSFDPRALLDVPAWGEKPLDQSIPVKLLPGQKAPPCDSQAFEEAINAGCWIGITAKPPCGRYFRQGDKCYAPVAEPKKLAP